MSLHACLDGLLPTSGEHFTSVAPYTFTSSVVFSPKPVEPKQNETVPLYQQNSHMQYQMLQSFLGKLKYIYFKNW